MDNFSKHELSASAATPNTAAAFNLKHKERANNHSYGQELEEQHQKLQDFDKSFNSSRKDVQFVDIMAYSGKIGRPYQHKQKQIKYK